MRLVQLALLLFVPIVAAGELRAQAGSPAPANSAGEHPAFETHVLPNGVRVWYRQVPGYPQINASVVVAAGSDDDPVGKRELARFAQHVQFGDRGGVTGEELRREVEARGGSVGANTYPDRTEYLLTAGAEHSPFALRWLGRLVSPPELTAGIVARQRARLEAAVQPPTLVGRLRAAYLNPPALRPPTDWERAFGVQMGAERDYEPYRTLERIGPADLAWFYQTYYVPSRMTVVVVSGAPRDSVLKVAATAFGALAARPAPAARPALADVGELRAETNWALHEHTLYRLSYRLVDVSMDDRVWLAWLRELLAKRLNDRLHDYGVRKAVYHADVALELRGSAALLTVSTETKEQDLAYVRTVIDREVEQLRTAAVPPEEFVADQDTIFQRLRGALGAPAAMEALARSHFAAAAPHDAPFPNVLDRADEAKPQELAEFMGPRFVRERQYVRVNHALPVSRPVLLAAVLALVVALVALARLRLVRPVDMRRLRHVVRLHVPPAYALVMGGSAVLVAAVLLRVAVYVAQRFAVDVLWSVDSIAVQWGAFGVGLAAAVWLAVAVLARVPRTLLVFDDAVAIKYAVYRCTLIRGAEIAELRLLGFRDVWLSRRIWRCVPLALGVRRPGIYLRQANGRAHYFSTRDPRAAMAVLSTYVIVRGQAPRAALPAPARSDAA